MSAPTPKSSTDFEFVLGILKTAELKVSYEATAELMGGEWTKQKLIQKMCTFRKQYDWPVPKPGVNTPKCKTSKRAAATEGDDVLETPSKSAKTPKKPAKAKVAEPAETSEEEAIEATAHDEMEE